MRTTCQSCGILLTGMAAKEKDGSDSFYCTSCYEKGRFIEPHITIYEIAKKTHPTADTPEYNAKVESIQKLRRWEISRRTAISCFNGAWDLMDKQDKTRKEIFEMIDRAHASAYHWKKVGDILNEARGAWQISRAYAVANMGESSLEYAKYSLDICLENGIKNFDIAFAYEAVARAYKVLNNESEMQRYKELALEACEQIHDEGDKSYALSEINSI